MHSCANNIKTKSISFFNIIEITSISHEKSIRKFIFVDDDCRDVVSLRGVLTGGAWPSSARVVRCWVKSRNERNPRPVLPARYGGHSRGTAGVNPEEGGDDVRSSCPLRPGLHACYNGRHSGMRCGDAERIP